MHKDSCNNYKNINNFEVLREIQSLEFKEKDEIVNSLVTNNFKMVDVNNIITLCLFTDFLIKFKNLKTLNINLSNNLLIVTVPCPFLNHFPSSLILIILQFI